MGSEVLAAASGAWVAVEDGLVVGAGGSDAPRGATALGDVVIAPGFVDLQVNGLGDVDFSRANPAGWRRAGARQLDSGVTSYLPTLTSAPLDRYEEAIGRAAVAAEEARAAGLARIEGVHLEGPFLGDAPGAHPRELLRVVDAAWLMATVDAWPGFVRLVTLAPEADPGLAGVRALVARDVLIALGHSRCSYEDAVAAADAGARLVTHLFNAMGPLAHRAPGLAGAALADDRLTPTLIADFVHVHPAVVAVAARATACALVTDAVAVEVDYGGRGVIEQDGAAWLDDGTLTGSTLTLDRAVRNVAELVGVARAVEMATTIPARLLELDTYGGRGIGGRADLVVLDATTLEVAAVWLAGTRVR